MRAKDVLIAQIFGGSSGGGGGGGAVDVNADVRFIDYDGEVVDSYSAEEFASLSALPANPSHEGLVAQGWNWSLADAQEYVADYGFLDIGQLYATESGATEIDISLSEGRTSPYLGFAVNGTAEVDWGDGSAVEEITGTSTYQSAVIRTKHDYPDAADYTIKINVSGAAVIHGSSDYSYLLTNGTGSYTPNYAYINAVKRIRMGEGMKVSMNGFTDLEHLESISIRGDSFEASLYYTFQNCYSIKSVTIPGGVTGIDYSAFASCYALNNVSLPKTLTAIGSYVFQDCSNLKRVSIPSGVSTVGSAFSGARTLEKFLLPSGSRFQGSSIFNSCPSLKYVELVGDTGGQ